MKPKQQPGRIVPRAVYAVGSRLLLGLLACAVVALVVLVSPVTIARTQEQRLVVGGRDRVYLLHLPPQYGGEARLPLVIMLHPRGDVSVQP